MFPTSLLFPVLSAAAVSAVSLHPLIARGTDEVWGGYNLTEQALAIQGSISSPTCNATEYCQTFVKQVVPRCLNLQGTAGCWCSLHDPLHYCALCMSNPTDNTTNPDQTQTATTAHGNYHKACGAYQAFLNQTATGSITSVLPGATSAASNSDSGSSFGTGALVGVIVGGIAGVVVIIAATFLIYRKMQNNKASGQNHVDAFYGGGGAGGSGMNGGGGGMGGQSEIKTPYQMGPTPPPPPPFIQYSHTPQPMSPMSEYNPRESSYTNAYSAVPGTAHSDTASNPGGHPSAGFSPPPPFVANPNMDYDTSMLTGFPPAGSQSGKFGRAAEPM